MQDYEYLFSKELHSKLKEKIKGKVWVKIYQDKLHVKITSQDEVIKYELTEDNMSTKILNGLSTQYTVYCILKDYSKCVNNKYFK